jgi:hypothetical protein
MMSTVRLALVDGTTADQRLLSHYVAAQVGLPYTLNEWSFQSRAIRGLCSGFGVMHFVAPMWIVVAPILVRGQGASPRFVLVSPVTAVLAAIGVAAVPVAGSSLEIIPITLLSAAVGASAGHLLVNFPLYFNRHHRWLDLSIHPPLICVLLFFYGLLLLYIYLTRLRLGPMVGLLIPVSSYATEKLGLLLMRRAFVLHYYKPKADFMSQAQSVSPMLSASTFCRGEVEHAFGYLVAFLALVVKNSKHAATIIEVVRVLPPQMLIGDPLLRSCTALHGLPIDQRHSSPLPTPHVVRGSSCAAKRGHIASGTHARLERVGHRRFLLAHSRRVHKNGVSEARPASPRRSCVSSVVAWATVVMDLPCRG